MLKANRQIRSYPPLLSGSSGQGIKGGRNEKQSICRSYSGGSHISDSGMRKYGRNAGKTAGGIGRIFSGCSADSSIGRSRCFFCRRIVFGGCGGSRHRGFGCRSFGGVDFRSGIVFRCGSGGIIGYGRDSGPDHGDRHSSEQRRL